MRHTTFGASRNAQGLGWAAPVSRRMAAVLGMLALLLVFSLIAGPLGTQTTSASPPVPMEQNEQTGEIRTPARSSSDERVLIVSDSDGSEFVMPVVAAPQAVVQEPVAPVAPVAPVPTLGQIIAGTALAYVGLPYVAAGTSPSGFDCSGFVFFIVMQTLGINVGTGLATQISSGFAVDYANLLPGDLVFFANTYASGLSHVAIYIGNGQIVHAENQSTGVRVSSLAGYYDAHYYGAVRLG